MTGTRDMESASKGVRVTTRFFPVSEALRPYCSIIYVTDVVAPDAMRVDDYLHPEWANLRFVTGAIPLAAIGGGDLQPTGSLIVTGPTSQATYFSFGTMRAWGIGILPLGWARFCDLPAEAMADRFCDGAMHSAFSGLVPLERELAAVDDPEAGARLIDTRIAERMAAASADDPAIREAHVALMDEALASVGAFANRLGLSERSTERLSRRAFGFPPKLLLRRQRFLRSLARFMLDPSMAWTDTLDYHYHDQAQFTHDFKRFMGMSPRAYAARPKPVLGAAARARAAAAGAAVQGLHNPAG